LLLWMDGAALASVLHVAGHPSSSHRSCPIIVVQSPLSNCRPRIAVAIAVAILHWRKHRRCHDGSVRQRSSPLPSTDGARRAPPLLPPTTTTAIRHQPFHRLPIPVFRNLFFGFKKPFLTGFLRISFFSCVFRRNFSQERGFGEVAGIPVFFRFYRNFSQEFLWEGIPLFSPDSSGFLRIPVPAKSCLA